MSPMLAASKPSEWKSFRAPSRICCRLRGSCPARERSSTSTSMSLISGLLLLTFTATHSRRQRYIKTFDDRTVRFDLELGVPLRYVNGQSNRTVRSIDDWEEQEKAMRIMGNEDGMG